MKSNGNFRNNNNRRNNQGGNFGGNNNYGGTLARNNVNPWDGNMGNMGNMNMNMNNNMGNMGRGNNNNNDALALANNLLNNLLRNQNQNNVPPSLLDMGGPRGGFNDGPRSYNDFRVSFNPSSLDFDVFVAKLPPSKDKLGSRTFSCSSNLTRKSILITTRT